VVAYEPRRGDGAAGAAGGGDRRLLSRDGRSTYLLATFKNGRFGPRVSRIEERLREVPWVVLGGSAIAFARSWPPERTARRR
jgi:hypothetical protein